ncbi:MAG TPA: ABC transporter permease [Kouleothrix sp.]|uniref:ABC transporter permease n=1 Tax=Kouleothrix sp. TaxID=2779161 RepID=UPI002C2F8CCF|nr:ABC transporter permease [Kouleothrix sp.]
MRRFFILAKANMLMNLRNRTALFWNFAFPIGLILLYGVIWREQIAWLTVGIVVLNLMSSGLLGDSSRLATLRERGVLWRVHATPLPAWQLIAAYVLARLVLVLGQSAVIVLTAVLVYGASFTWAGLAMALPYALAGGLVFLVIGQLISAVAPTGGAAGAIGQALYFPLMFVSNLFMPLELLPRWLSNISIWTPATMLVDLIRPRMLPIPAAQAPLVDLLGLLCYGAVALVLAGRLFRWEQR